MNLKQRLKKQLSPVQIKKLRDFINYGKSLGHGCDLTKLAKIYKADKFGEHQYTPIYMKYLEKLKYKKVNLLEIGVGGYENPREGCNSLLMWKRYFPFGRIYSIDIYDKSFFATKRIKIFKGSQNDEQFLKKLIQ